MEELDLSACFKALCDDTRLAIFSQLQGKQLCACQLLEDLNITQPTLSFHMKKLIECGLVVGHKDGIWVRYHVNTKLVKQLSLFLDGFVVDSFDDCERGCAA